MSVTTGRIHGSASFIVDIRTLSCPGALFDWNAMIVLRTSPRETGAKLKLCDSATASDALVGGASSYIILLKMHNLLNSPTN